MAKILITALGSGTYNKEKNEKEYKPATYYVEDGHPLKETEFIASAIHEQWKMDKIIFIGTTGSMWSNVYKFYCNNKGIKKDEDYYNKLKNTELKANKDTPIEKLEIEKFNTTFDEKIKGIVIKYGVNNMENLENFHSIIEIEKEIEDGDEIFIDITHSFRSMSFWLFLIMTYLKDVSNKNIDIKILKGVTPKQYRIRLGDYRVIFNITKKKTIRLYSIFIIKADYRGNVYKK